MELYQLRSFVKVARLGNLTRAADELHLTQPAVSSQIKLLEEEVGERLLERLGRGIALTGAGERLRERATEILSLADVAKQEIAAITALRRGSISIGTNDSNCLHVLPDVIATFAADYPEVRLHLDNGHSSDVARWVAEGRVEIGIATLPVAGRGLRSERLYDREDVLICRPDHALATEGRVEPVDLARYPLLMLHGGSVSHARLDGILEQANATPERIMRVGSIEVIKRYVEIGLGVSVVPSLNVRFEIAEGRLCARSLEWLPGNQVGIVRRRSGHLSPAARVFVERLRAYVAETVRR
ncbi:MAG: LysR family transcriptional regulator [Spirochaetota bacterium]